MADPLTPAPEPSQDASRWCPAKYATATQTWESSGVPDHCAGCGATYAEHVPEPSQEPEGAPKPETLEKARETLPFMLPDGRIVDIHADVARYQSLITFQLASGEVVKAVRVRE